MRNEHDKGNPIVDAHGSFEITVANPASYMPLQMTTTGDYNAKIVNFNASKNWTGEKYVIYLLISIIYS